MRKAAFLRFSQGASCRERSVRLWHITERGWASDILNRGFYGSWGDCAFGVYLFDSWSMAADWAVGNPNMKYEDPVMIEVQVPREDVETCEEILGYLPPDWEPEREKYEHVFVHEIDEDTKDRWRPKNLKMVELTSTP